MLNNESIPLAIMILLFDTLVFIAWFNFGKEILFFLNRVKFSKNNCKNKVTEVFFEDLYDNAITQFLFFAIIISAVYIAYITRFKNIKKMFLDGNLLQGTLSDFFNLDDFNVSILLLPSFLVIIALLLSVHKHKIISSATKCIEHINCNCTH